VRNCRLHRLCTVVVSAWVDGIGPGMLAVGLATLAVDYFLMAPLYSVPPELYYLPRGAVFTLSALLVGGLAVRR
jgi:K+-sensing histidine kinase KdpD